MVSDPWVSAAARDVQFRRGKASLNPMTMSLQLAHATPVPILALGPQTKNTICALRDATAVMSDEHADLDDADTYRAFVRTADRMRGLLGADVIVACDAHPTYASSYFARSLGRPVVEVQHHFAHAAGAAADAGVEPPFIGVVCDGTGYGADGHAWGGEVLTCDGGGFERAAHLCYFPLPGGDAAVREPWRTAYALALAATRGTGIPAIPSGVFSKVDRAALRLVDQQIRAGVNLPLSSSLGRLFDGVAFLLGLCGVSPTPGTVPGMLERAAASANADGLYPPEMLTAGRARLLDWRPLVAGLLRDQAAGHEAAQLAARFHATVAEMFARATAAVAHDRGTDRVVLSGGCFFNARLRAGLTGRLEVAGLQVALPRRVSTGDAGVSLGQAVAAAQRCGARRRSAHDDLEHEFAASA